MVSTSSNGLICFTNCLLPQEDGCLIEKNLWVDETQGLILDAQVRVSAGYILLSLSFRIENVLHRQTKA